MFLFSVLTQLLLYFGAIEINWTEIILNLLSQSNWRPTAVGESAACFTVSVYASDELFVLSTCKFDENTQHHNFKMNQRGLH